jgi:hypothetical protein
VLLHAWMGTLAESIRYNPVSGEVVEGRLGKYAGNNKQRETTLKQRFAEVANDQHLSEQPVKGSKLPLHRATGLLNARPGEDVQGDRAHIAEGVVVVRRHT